MPGVESSILSESFNVDVGGFSSQTETIDSVTIPKDELWYLSRFIVITKNLEGQSLNPGATATLSIVEGAFTRSFSESFDATSNPISVERQLGFFADGVMVDEIKGSVLLDNSDGQLGPTADFDIEVRLEARRVL